MRMPSDPEFWDFVTKVAVLLVGLLAIAVATTLGDTP